MIAMVIAIVIVYLGVTEGVGWYWWLVAVLASLASLTPEGYLWPTIRRWARERQVRRSNEPGSLTGSEFERWTASRFEKQGYKTEVTGGSGDGGCDVLARRNGRVIAVQCKRLSSSLGSRSVKDAVTGRALHDADEAWVITTAPSITKQARDLARRTGVEIHQV